jgi:hypothetical protein
MNPLKLVSRAEPSCFVAGRKPFDDEQGFDSRTPILIKRCSDAAKELGVPLHESDAAGVETSPRLRPDAEKSRKRCRGKQKRN